MLYYFAPDAEQDWVWITPGSVLATTLWVVISLGFKSYISNFGNYTETYGLIGGVMVLLLWFYLSGIAILVGAELNAEIEHASPLRQGRRREGPGEKKKIGAARRSATTRSARQRARSRSSRSPKASTATSNPARRATRTAASARATC